MNTDQLIEKIRADGAALFGTGFVAELFYEALAGIGLAERICCCVVSDGGAEPFHGLPVYSLEQYAAEAHACDNGRSPVLCLSVHDSIRAEIEAGLRSAGCNDYVWIYPHYLQLAWGEAIREPVRIAPREILRMQPGDQYWITVRYAAMRELQNGTDDMAGEIYRKAIGLFSGAGTARKRLASADALVRSIRENGFRQDRPILIDSRYRVLDGLHRLAAAALLGLPYVPCRIVAASDRFDAFFTEDNRLTDQAQRKAGLTAEERLFLKEARNELCGEDRCGAPEISVILPVYNVQEYIDTCMDSLARQTMTDLEILLINDGSTDASLQKCLDWRQRDARVLVFDCDNGGVAAARNFGLRMARGKYIAFVDPDDWVEDTYLEKLWRAAEENNAAFAECDLWRYDNRSGKKIYRACYGRMGRAYTLREHMKYGPTATYKSISRKSLWEDNGVLMPSCSFESPAVYSLLLALSGHAASVREPLYYYRRFRDNSLIENGYAGKDGRANNTLGIEAMSFLLSEFRRTGLYEQYADVLEGVVKYRLSDILAMQFHRKNPEDFRALSENYRLFLGKCFPDGHNAPYITWGGYNLNRILTHMDWLHDPNTRFGFSSIICASDPSPVKFSVLHKNRYRQIMLARELKRDFSRILAESEPDFMFIDLLEERFDILCLDGQYLTISDAFESARFLAAGSDTEIAAQELISRGRVIPRCSAECTALWQSSAEKFFGEIQSCRPALRFVIVENYLCETVGTLAERQPFPELSKLRQTNGILREYYVRLRALLPDAIVISPAGDPLYFTDSMYEYGALPSHLNELENQKIAAAIEKAI